jgi:transposase-like protein
MRNVTFRKKDNILSHLRQQPSSGLTVEDYCGEHSIAVSTFFNWRKKYSTEPATPPQSAPFAHVSVSPPGATQFDILYNNLTIRVPVGLEQSSLRELFTVLLEER